MKIAFDVTPVVISAIVCLFAKGELGSVGAGTIAVTVGVVSGVVQRLSGNREKRFLGNKE